MTHQFLTTLPLVKTWPIFGVIKTASRFEQGRPGVSEALAFLVESQYITTSNFRPFLDVIVPFIRGLDVPGQSHQNSQSRECTVALQTLELLSQNLTTESTNDRISNEDKGLGLDNCWLLMLKTMYDHLDDNRVLVARQSWESLHNALLLTGSKVTTGAWSSCFDEFLFQLADKAR